jgi:hypothetical protein
MVLWPESSTPFHFKEQPEQAARVRALARDAKVPILIGSDEIERGVPARYYNSAFLLRPDGADAGVYRKMHLVPFGEYVPLKRVLFFAAPLVEAAGDFSAGESAVLLPVGGHLISAAICYEIVYPDLVRRFVVAGSEMLTTITNDAWFGATSATSFAQASMRAIRTAVPRPRGEHRHPAGSNGSRPGRRAGRIYEPAVIVSDARFRVCDILHANGRRVRSPVGHRHAGDADGRAPQASAHAELQIADSRLQTYSGVACNVLFDLPSGSVRTLPWYLKVSKCGYRRTGRRYDDLKKRAAVRVFFETARPEEELSRLEMRAAAPDFWKDQAGPENPAAAPGGWAGCDLMSLGKKATIWPSCSNGRMRRDGRCRINGRSTLDREVETGEIKKISAASTIARTPSPFTRGGAWNRGLGRDAAAHVSRCWNAAGSSARSSTTGQAKGRTEGVPSRSWRTCGLPSARQRAQLVRISPFDRPPGAPPL